MSSSASYTSPVNQIFQLAPPPAIVDWSIYANLGIAVEHLPELTRMAIDEDLLYGEEEADFLAPPHAWRMLAVVGTPEAVAPLITVLHDWSEENWDWLGEEIKVVFGKIGTTALPELAKTLSNIDHNHYTRENAVMSIAEIFEHHPAAHDECIAVLTAQLSRFSKNDPDLNGYLVAALAADFQAVESAKVIEQAYQSGRVNEDFIGNWDSAQVRLGLKDPSELPPRSRNIVTDPWEFVPPEPSGFAIGRNKVPKTKTTAKRKTQTQSRRQNRKKK